VSKPASKGSKKEAALILVVEDFGAAREVYVHLLASSGLRVVEASNGPEAIAKGLALRPDLILMDLAMPGMDGLEVMRRLKADDRTKASPIVVITGASYADGARKAKAAGCDAYLIKPCAPEVLLRVVHDLLKTA
jgi:CheY-like chemotaxis protein